MKFLKKVVNFCKEVVVVAAKKVWGFVKGVYRHAETVTILVLATFGLANLLGELPFMFSLPMWVEAPFVAPVLAVLLIKLLIKISDKRIQRREVHHAQTVIPAL